MSSGAFRKPSRRRGGMEGSSETSAQARAQERTPFPLIQASTHTYRQHEHRPDTQQRRNPVRQTA